MYALLNVLYAAEQEDDSDPLQHPYNQEVLRVIRQTFTADNESVIWANDEYTVGTSWVSNRLKCCRAIADFATVIATSSHKAKLTGLLDEFRDDVVATVDYFWLEANQMTYENTEMALLAITLVKGPLAMLPFVRFHILPIFSKLCSLVEMQLDKVRNICSIECQISDGRSLAGQYFDQCGSVDLAPWFVPRRNDRIYEQGIFILRNYIE